MLIKSFTILVNEYNFPGDLYILGSIRKTMAISSYIYYREKDLYRYAELKKIAERVKFIGLVSQEEMAHFYYLAKGFISISLYEGFGLPALEAMTAGCPAVLSNLGAYPEIASNAAIFVYPYGPHRIADALNQLLTDTQMRETVIENGIKRAQFFDRRIIAKRMLEIYQEIYDDYQVNYQP